VSDFRGDEGWRCNRPHAFFTFCSSPGGRSDSFLTFCSSPFRVWIRVPRPRGRPWLSPYLASCPSAGSHRLLASFSPLSSTLGVCSVWLIFVSARTNKRHHRHVHLTLPCEILPKPIFSDSFVKRSQFVFHSLGLCHGWKEVRLNFAELHRDPTSDRPGFQDHFLIEIEDRGPVTVCVCVRERDRQLN